MATYVIGDIHGCFLTLRRLLDKIEYSSNDRLWLVGDLVNRGPRSLEVLRWAHDLGPQLVTVLGNHDVHLLKSAFNLASAARMKQFNTLLAAADSAALIDWLRHRPVIHVEKPYVLVHAGLLPHWNVEEAERFGREVEEVLRGGHVAELLMRHLPKNLSASDKQLVGMEKHSSVLKVMTQLRTIGLDGRVRFDFTGPLQELPKHEMAWFSVQPRKSQSHTILFGHWAALGFYQAPGILALDSGCAWGGSLTAVRLEDQAVFQQQNVEGIPEGSSSLKVP
jgi:bis(5'-nucleosyl)-tetraphosphatase (symmetrical)